MDNTRRNKTNNINLIEEVIYLVGNRPAVLRLNLLQPSVTAEDEDMGEREVTFHLNLQKICVQNGHHHVPSDHL